MAELATLGFGADTRGLVEADKRLDQVTKSAGRAENASNKLDKEFGGLSKTSMAVSRSISSLAVGLAGVFSVTAATRSIVNYSDAWRNVENQLKQVTSSASELSEIQDILISVSNETRSSFDSTANLYARLARSTTELGVSSEELIDITTTINKAFAASGATATEASAAITQLSQGLASGALRGDEFNSVAEQAPAIMRAIADSLDLTIGELREFAAEGGITAQIVIDALKGASDEISGNFANTSRTFGQALTVANNNMIDFVGGVDAVQDAVGSAGDAIVVLSENLDLAKDAAIVLSGVLASRLAGSVSATAISFAAGTVQNIRYQATLASMAGLSTTAALRITALGVAAKGTSAAMAFFGGPIGLAITGVAGAVYYLSTRQTEAEKAALQHESAVMALNEALAQGNSLSEKSAQAARDEAQASISVAFAKLEQLEAQLKINRLAEKMAGEAPIQSPFDQPTDLTSNLKTQISDQISRIETLRDKIIELNNATDQSTPPEIVSKASQVAISETGDEIQKVIDALEFERQQLMRTDREQAVYNALKRAGITAANDNADAVRNAATALFDLEEKLEDAAEEQKSFLEAVEKSYEGRERINDLVEGLEIQRKQVGMLASEVEKLNTVREAQKIADEAGIVLSDRTIEKIEQEIDARHRLQELENLKVNDFGLGQIGGMNEYGTIGETGPFNDLMRYQSQLTSLQEAEAEKLEVVRAAMDARAITEQEGQDRITEIQRAAEQQRAALVNASNSAILLGSSQMFGDLATIAQGFAGEQSGIFKAMFVASKAFAIADSIIKIQQGLASALSLPFPANLAAMGSVAAAGASIISNIQAVQGAGFKDGGYTGNVGTSSVAGVVHGQEFVVNAQATKKNRGVLEAMNAGKPVTGGMPNITIQNFGTDVEVQQLTENDVVIISRQVAKDVVREDAPQVIAADMANPNSRTTTALRRNTNVQVKR